MRFAAQKLQRVPTGEPKFVGTRSVCFAKRRTYRAGDMGGENRQLKCVLLRKNLSELLRRGIQNRRSLLCVLREATYIQSWRNVRLNSAAQMCFAAQKLERAPTGLIGLERIHQLINEMSQHTWLNHHCGCNAVSSSP